MKGLAKANQVLFGYTTAHSLAVLRILVGAVGFCSWLALAPWFSSWYSETGYLPNDTLKLYAGPEWTFNPLMWVPGDGFAMTVFGLVLVSSFTSMIGYRTRLSLWVMFLCTVALHHRNPIILNSGDTLLRQAIFILALSQCGQVWSIDRKRMGGSGDNVLVPVWPQRLIQAQLAVMYITTVIHKLRGTMWIDGTAAWYPTRLTEFNRFPVPPFVDAPPFLQMATWGTLVLELALGSLVFTKELRKWVVISGLFLHLVIEYRFNIPFFAFICMSLYVAHYNGNEVKAFVEKWKPKIQAICQKFVKVKPKNSDNLST